MQYCVVTETHAVSDLCPHSDFWTHMNFCANLMNDMCDIVVDKAKIRPALSILGTSFVSFRGWEELTRDWNAVIGETSLSAALFYLLEGAIPLVTSLCSALHSTRHDYMPFKSNATASSSIWNFFTGLQVRLGNEKIREWLSD